jgi:hypothetical protein
MEIEKHFSAQPAPQPKRQRKQNYAPKIRVCIRKRPLSTKEKNKGEKDIVNVRNGNEVRVKEKKVKHLLFPQPSQSHKSTGTPIDLSIYLP